jgi:hypothetical protein
MGLAVSYLNNSHTDVQDSAVKLVFEVIKRIGRVEVAQYLTDVQPSSLESILNLLTEWEETTGKVAGKLLLFFFFFFFFKKKMIIILNVHSCIHVFIYSFIYL